MTKLHWGVFGVLVGALTLAGCGDDTTASSTTTGAGGAPTTSSTTTSGGGEGGQGGGAGGGGDQGGAGGAGQGGQGGGSVCGDGVVEGGEQCEPPGTPTCTANCQTPSSCDMAPVLMLGDQVGDTTNGVNNADGSCQLMNGFDQVYNFTPPAGGTVTLKLTADADLGLHARTTCDDPTTEIGCSDANPAGIGVIETLTVPVTLGVPIFVFVDGYIDRVGGPYTLNVAQP